MKVAFDCSLVPGQRAGVGQYSLMLARALACAGGENSYMFYVLTPAWRKVEASSLGLPEGPNSRVVVKRLPAPYQLFRHLALPGAPAYFREYALGGLDADIVHSNSFCVPRFRPGRRKKKVVATIYDASVLTHPECHTRANASHCLHGIREAVEHADAIIAISRHTRDDLVSRFGAAAERITVTHLAAGPDYRPVADEAELAAARRKYGLPERYILFVGSLEPRKNVRTLLRAYAALPEAVKKEYSLAIAGGKGWMSSDMPGLARSLGIDKRTVFAGYIDSADISAVYSAAALFAYPSLYEGFGLPVLEAMSCAAPVVTSNVSSIPEVAGEAAMLVDPMDEGALASAMAALLSDEALRREMKRKGLERAAMFSWDRCARQTLAVYEKAARGG